MRLLSCGVPPTRPDYVPPLPPPSFSVDGAEEKGYDKLPPLDELMAVHLCPSTAVGWKAHPPKPCRTTLDGPTPRLDSRPQRSIPWRFSRSFRPNFSVLWTSLAQTLH
ncbi:hypothetical protein QQF64_004522 [Cirrhinus molitorella]|uniref:Uncharacterized protein n=1 Tax=Cirrhinus molitorella TaxID=172907 RepID=A0ABR3MGF5_9TELE